VTVDLVTQELYHVGSHEKLSLLLGLLDREKPESCLIFCNQKFMVEELARRLKINGYDCEFIMGDLPQQKRLEVIERVKAGKIKMLVATDVAARGLDIDALALVINYDVPEDAESYVHRIGRTARAGKAGKAITLACEKFVYGLYSIEKYLGDKIPVMPFDEALLLEDRSSGMRFSRDRGGQGRGRDDRRSGGRSEGRGPSYGSGRSGESRDNRDRRDQGPRRPSGPRRDHAPAQEQGARAPERSAQGPRPSGQRNAPRPGQKPGQRPASQAPRREGDPYALPQEERMKMYKEKYEPKAGGKPQGQKPQGPRPQGQKPQPQGQKAKGAPRGPQGSRAGNANVRGAGNAAASAPKPSLVDRIKGIFGGKKKDQRPSQK
jgi:ATP-dependent RNA helicase RhlB